MVGIRNSYKLWSVYLKGRAHLEILNIDGNIILRWVLRKQDMMASSDQDRAQWQDLASMVMNFRFP
jgi:hypothetical protein